MQKIPCRNCPGVELEVADPRLELINQMSVSMIIWAHPDQVSCPQCGDMFIGHIPMIPLENIKMGFLQIGSDGIAKVVEKSRILIPGR